VKERKLSQVVVFCVVTPCANVVEHQRFGGPYCLHLQSEVWRGKLNEKIYVNFWGLFAWSIRRKTNYQSVCGYQEKTN